MPYLPKDQFNTSAMKMRKYRRMLKVLSPAVQAMQSTWIELLQPR